MSCKWVLIVSLLLAGCAQTQVSSFEPYTPEKQVVNNYQADLTLCRTYALNYLKNSGPIDPTAIAQESLSGALTGVSNLPLSIYAPAYGSVSGGSTEALDELGLNSKAGKTIVAWCMHDKGLKDGFSTWDPNL